MHKTLAALGLRVGGCVALGPSLRVVGRPVSDGEILDALRQVATDAHSPMSSLEYIELRPPGLPSASIACRRFGSWSKALEAAGLPPTGRAFQRWTPDEAIDAVAAWMATTDDHRYVAYLGATRSDPTLPRVVALTRLFTGWKGTVAAVRARSLDA